MNFEIKDIGEASYVIGIQIFHDRSQWLLKLSKKGYIEEVLERFNMNNYCSNLKVENFSPMQCPTNYLEWKKWTQFLTLLLLEVWCMFKLAQDQILAQWGCLENVKVILELIIEKF